MFFTKKKTQLEKMIDDSGIDTVAQQLSVLINEKIPSLEVARQFILEELDAASAGNHIAQQFVLDSGFEDHEYKGALHNSFDEVDGENGPQQFLNVLLLSQIKNDMDLMISLRVKIVDHLMRHWELGRYALDNTVEENMTDVFMFDNSANVISAPKGESALIAVLNAIEMILKNQMLWHVQKIDYGKNHQDGVLFAVVGQAYLKFNGPDIHEAKAVEASECTLGIIEHDLDVIPTVMLQLSFNFYAHEIQTQLRFFDSRPNGGYNAIKGLDSLVSFTREEFLGSFANVNPDSELEQLLKQFPLYDSELLFDQTFTKGPLDFAQHLLDVMNEVSQIAIHTTINL
jgi:hypothetical protein